MSKYLFVSDIHGRYPELEEKLLAAATNGNHEIVFFLGDIVGTESLDKLQKLFYNSIVNPAKSILRENSQISDQELLFARDCHGKTIVDGGIEIWRFLFGDTPSTEQAAKYVRELIKYTHFGHFVSNLPEPIRQMLQEDMEKNARVWIDIMTQFTDNGSLVVIVEGNWDARTPLDFVADKTNCQAMPNEERSFYFKKYLKSLNKKVLYFDQVGTLETEDEIFVLWPFDCAVNTTEVPEFEDEETRKIVLVSHSQIDWESVKGDTPMTAEGHKIQDNMPMTFRDVKANTAVHGHLHDKIGTDGYLFDGKFIHYLPMRIMREISFI